MPRVALYARFSSENQKDSSIEQQLRLLRERAMAEGWDIVGEYSDKALSGSNMLRPGLQNLLAASRQKLFDIVLSESIDRLSRDQGDIAHMHKRFRHLGIEIVTLMEGEINELHIGLKGTMSALYIRDLARRTHRGLQDRALKGESAGGLAYGYEIERRWDAKGKQIGGLHTINEEQAIIVRRIMSEYADGKSPRWIAHDLNADGILAQRGRPWSDTTICGNRRRGTGTINNERYVGRLVWNRQHFTVDPDTGRGNGRLNDESAWVRSEVPHLRIVDDELWNRVKARQKALDQQHPVRPNGRPKYLFSFLIKCGECQGGMSKISATHIGCSTARAKGTCANRLTISRKKLEETILGALRERLVNPALCDVFCVEYVAHLNRLRAGHGADQIDRRNELARVERDIAKMITAIKQGVDPDLLKDEINGLQRRKLELTELVELKTASPVFIHPNMASRYRDAVEHLVASLNDPEHKDASIDVIRRLIDKIVLTPDDDRSDLVIDLHGDLAGILQIASGRVPATEAGTKSLTIDELSEVKTVKKLANALVCGGDLASASLDCFPPPQPVLPVPNAASPSRRRFEHRIGTTFRLVSPAG